MNTSLSYLQIENAIIHSLVLSGNEKLFYIALKSFRNRKTKLCFPSIRRIIERVGISKKTAYKCRGRLKNFGLISWTNESGRKHSCHYRFTLNDGGEAEIKRILEILNGEKIGENKTSLNREKKNHSNRGKGNLKIGKNETTNNKNITKGNITNRGSESLPASLSFKEREIKPMPDWVKKKLNKIFTPNPTEVNREKEEKQRAKLLMQAKELKEGKVDLL